MRMRIVKLRLEGITQAQKKAMVSLGGRAARLVCFAKKPVQGLTQMIAASLAGLRTIWKIWSRRVRITATLFGPHRGDALAETASHLFKNDLIYLLSPVQDP